MAKTVLPHGIVQPEIGSTNWGSDVNQNFKKLDDLIGDSQKNYSYTDANNQFSGTNTFSKPIQGDLNGTADKALKDDQGRTISSTYANNDNVVHKTDNETVDGVKTFTNGIVSKVSYDTKETVQGTDYYYVLNANNSKSKVYAKNDTNGNYTTVSAFNDDNTNSSRIEVKSKDNDNTITWNGLLLNSVIPFQNNRYSIGSSSNKWSDVNTVLLNGKEPAYKTDIPTIPTNVSAFTNDSGYLTSNDIIGKAEKSEVVKLNGDQTVNGEKTFTNDLLVTKTKPFVKITTTDYNKGTAPSNSIYQGLRFYDNPNNEVENHITGAFEIAYEDNGYNSSYINARNYDGTTQLNYNVSLRVPNDKNKVIEFIPSVNNKISLGSDTNKWANVNTVLLNGQTPVYTTDLTQYNTHINDSNIHVTPSDKTLWTNKQEALSATQIMAVNSGITAEKVLTYDGYEEQKADDEDVVHKNGSETINGLKTFTSVITALPKGIGTHGYVVKVPFNRGDTENTEGTALTGTNHATFRVIDKDANIISEYCTENYVDGKVAQILNLRNTDDNGNQVQSSISHLLDKNAEQDWFYPLRNDKVMLGTSTNKWKDVNTTLLNGKTPAYDTDVVHNTGNETVNGSKTFTSSINLEGSGRLYQTFATDYIKGGVPSAISYQGLRFYDDQKISTVANHITGAFEMQYGTDGYNKAYVGCRNYADTTQHNYTVGLRVPNDLTRSIDFLPSATDKINLGTTDYKWADVNTTLLNGKIPAYNVDVIHNSGDENVNGTKTFNENIRVQGSYRGDEFSTNARTVLELRANRDTEDKSGIYISKFRQNKAQGEMSDGDFHILGIDVLENGVRSNEVFRFSFKGWVDDIPTKAYLEPNNSNTQASLGSTAHQWSDVQTEKVNGEDVVTPTYLNTKTESWEFTLEDGSTVTKKIVCL